MSVAGVLHKLRMVPSPHEIFPRLDTPFSEYSHSNHIASISEFPEIRKIFSERRSQLNDIDSIILQLENILAQYREKREQIVSSLKAHKGFVSCLRRFPPEILEQIFIHCLPSRMDEQPSVQVAPLFLTGICRAWRNVVLNAPSLWCSLAARNPEQHLLSYDSWLKRAKSYPLALEVRIPSLASDPGCRKAVMDVLQPYTNRLKKLTISFREVDGFNRFLGNVPMLESLSLSGDIGGLEGTQVISIIQPQPRLRALIIHSRVFDMENFSALSPGWENLTRLALVLGGSWHARSHIMLRLLQECHNLEHFVFSPVCTSLPDDSDSVSFTHTKLRLLDIADVMWHNLPLFTLTLPNLHYLHVRDNFDSEDVDSDHLDYGSVSLEDVFNLEHPLLESKHHRVLNMKVVPYIEVGFNGEFFTVLDPGWTTITHIRVEFTGCADNFLHVLVLCPNLECLVISLLGVHVTVNCEVPVYHPVLRSLSIKLRRGFDCSLLDFVTLSGLRHLELLLPGAKFWPHANFKTFVSRSECPLETLKISGPIIPVEQCEGFRSFVPSLRRVELFEDGHNITDSDDVPLAVPFYTWSTQ